MGLGCLDATELNYCCERRVERVRESVQDDFLLFPGPITESVLLEHFGLNPLRLESFVSFFLSVSLSLSLSVSLALSLTIPSSGSPSYAGWL